VVTFTDRIAVTSKTARSRPAKKCAVALILQFANEFLRNGLRAGSPHFAAKRGVLMQVLVRDNNVDQALRVLKKKMQREGVFREMKQRRAYEKPSERKTREKSEAIRRARKLARKQAIREGFLPAPLKKKLPERRPPLPQTSGSAGWRTSTS
jgi:small subunit ribosomal protein S21